MTDNRHILPECRDEEMWLLCSAMCDGTIDAQGLARLESLSEADPSNRLFCAAYMRMNGRLMRMFRPVVAMSAPSPFFAPVKKGTGSEPISINAAGNGGSEAPVPLFQPNIFSPGISPEHFGGLGGAWNSAVGYLSSHELFSGYLVATVLFAVAVAIGLNVYVSSTVPQQYVSRPAEAPRTPRQSYQHEPEQEKIVSIARITGMVDCVWANTDDAPFHDRVVLGTKYMLKSGLMEITYYTGAKVILQGPCTYEVESPVGGYLSLGKLTARVESRSRLPSGTLPTDSNTSKSRPADGTYFSVRTPTAVVTDLGTEFGVEVAKSGDTVSHVFVGKIRVKSVNWVSGNNGREVVLGVNESVRVEKSVADHTETPLVIRRGECKPGEYVRVEQMAAKVKEVQERPLKAFRQWQAFSKNLRNRDDLLAYYDFQRDADDPRGENGCQIMRNRAKTGPKFDGLVWGTLRMGMAQGRCQGKQALQFDNQDDGVVINIPACKQLTLAAWINLDEVPTESSSLVMSDNVPPGMCHWQIGPGAEIGGPSSPALIRGQWLFVAVAYDCVVGTAEFYFNGEPCGDMSLNGRLPPMMAIGHATIGAWNHENRNERVLPGRMDELMIFQSALSASEIRRLYKLK